MCICTVGHYSVITGNGPVPRRAAWMGLSNYAAGTKPAARRSARCDFVHVTHGLEMTEPRRCRAAVARSWRGEVGAAVKG